MPSSDQRYKDDVRAAREFLLGRSDAPDRTAGNRSGSEANGRAEQTATLTPEGAVRRLELSAPDIRRTASGWRARCIHARGVDSRYVNDGRYGPYVGSFIAALDVRDSFYRDRGMPIPWEVEAIVDGERIAPEVVRRGRSIVVRWQGQEHVVTGEDAEEIATELALDLFVEFLDTLRPEAPAE